MSHNRNEGPDAQRLQYCDFAGWDSEKQFGFVDVKEVTPEKEKQPLKENCSSEKELCDEKAAGTALKETIPSYTLRSVEGGMEIPAGERISIVVSCRAK